MRWRLKLPGFRVGVAGPELTATTGEVPSITRTTTGTRNMRSQLSATRAALTIQYAARSGEFGRMEDAISTLRTIADQARPGSAASLIAVRNLANGLALRAAATQAVDDLLAAEPVVADALDSTPPGHRFRRSMLLVRAMTSTIRAIAFNDGGAATECIEASEEALELPLTDELRASHLMQAGSAYLLRYMAWRDSTDLDAAIDRLEAYLTRHRRHREHSKGLNNLSNAYSEKYDLTGATADFDRALELTVSAIGASSDANRLEPSLNLARLLLKRYSARRDSMDLESAREIIEQMPGKPAGLENPRRTAHQLALAASALADECSDEAVLNTALALQGRAVAMLPPTDGEWAQQSANLAAIMSNLARLQKDSTGMRTALGLMREACDGLADAGKQHALCISNIGQTLAWLYQTGQSPRDLSEARDQLRNGATMALAASPDVGVRTARTWLDLELDGLAEEASSLRDASAILAQACIQSLSAENSIGTYRQRVEATASQILEAAGGLVRAGDPAEAVETLNLYRRLRTRLDLGLAIADAGRASRRTTSDRQRPVVYVWPTAKCGWLLIDRGGGSIDVCPLPGFATPSVAQRLQDLYGSYARHRDSKEPDSNTLAQWRRALEECASWTWDSVAHRIADAELGRAALVPFGIAGSLPWQAASGMSAVGSRTWLVDTVCLEFPIWGDGASSSEIDGVPDALVATASQDEAHNYLQFAAIEADLVAQAFAPRAALVSDPRRCLELLESVDVAHFSCHGRLDHDEPTRSTLQVGGETVLSAADISRLDCSNVAMVYLSACETSATRVRSADSPEGLAHAFLSSGAGSVVASRWLVPDTASMMLAKAFYERWRFGTPGPEALTDAQVWIRKASGRSIAAELSPFVSSNDPLIRELEAAGDEPVWEHPFYWAAFGWIGSRDARIVSND